MRNLQQQYNATREASAIEKAETITEAVNRIVAAKANGCGPDCTTLTADAALVVSVVSEFLM
jgi:hypothetical protein